MSESNIDDDITTGNSNVAKATRRIEKAAADKDLSEAKRSDTMPIAQQLLENDIIGRFMAKGLIPNRYIVSGTGNKIMMLPQVLRTASHNAPWCYTCNSGDRACQFRLDIEECFGFIPRHCMNCWKVVVYPQNIIELFKLYEIQKEMIRHDPYCLCKCGIEVRDEVERNYGGYFYNNSLAAGLDRLDQVREIVAKKMAPGTRVILKRACTEYERKYGDSDKWDEKFSGPDYLAINDLIEDVCAIEQEYPHQPKLIEAHVLASWIRYAASIGDPALKELNGGKNLYPDYVSYEQDGAYLNNKKREVKDNA